MKLTTLILIISLMQVSAASFGQRLTLIGNNVKLERVFNEIQKQTGYGVLVSTSKVDTEKGVKVNFRNTVLTEVMDQLTKGSDLAYTIEDKVIVIKEKTPSILDRVIARFQAIDVRGKVVDSLGNGLPGATVSVKNGKGSTSTDAGGNFQLKNVDEGAVLVVSYLGYVTREVTVVDEFLTIRLRQSESRLDEVQIQAYGSVSKRLNVGNIGTVRSEEIDKQIVQNPLLALQARVPGLIVTQTTGLVGGAVNAQIRGNNSLGRVTSPLFVIDGLPIANNIPGIAPSSTGYLQDLSAISFINPDDIFSIDVLKDADATSIYGSRGANGAILITTKKGRAGATSIEVSGQFGMGYVANKLSMLSTKEYLDLRKEAHANVGIDFINKHPFDIESLKYDVAPDLFIWSQTRFTDWQEKLIGGTAQYTNYKGSISGGSDNVRYSLRGNYNKSTTVFPGETADQKSSVLFSLNTKSKDQKLISTISASYLNNITTLPGTDLTGVALTLAPNAPEVFNENGTLNWETYNGRSTWNNPYRDIFYQPFDANVKNLISSGSFEYRITSAFSAKVTGGYNDLNGNSTRSLLRAGLPPQSLNTLASSIFSSNRVLNISVEPQVNFTTTIFNGRMDFLGGGSYQSTRLANGSISARGFSSDALVRNLASANQSQTVMNNSSSEYKYNAIFGRFSYNRGDKYLFNANIRRDGSSRFGPGNKFGTFGSVGVAWIFSDEEWVKSNIRLLSFGKFRLTYGSSGNDGISDYQYFERYSVPQLNARNYQGAQGLETSGIFNEYYHWETTRKFEVGLETGFFGDRLLLDGAYFRNRSDNQLLSAPFPSTVGPGSAIINRPALIQNSGLELILSADNIKTRKFSWKSTLNLTTNRNKLIAYPDFEASADYYAYELGRPFYGYIRSYKNGGVDPSSGIYQFQNSNGETVLNPRDETERFGGNTVRTTIVPQFYGGFSNSFAYGHLSLDVFFQFVKQTGRSHLDSFLGRAGSQVVNLPKEFLNRWTKEGDQTNIQKLVAFGGSNIDEYTSGNDLFKGSDGVLTDASFIRLQNVSLSYVLPKNVTSLLRISEFRVFIQGQNLLTITKYKGLDPETQSTSSLPPLTTLLTGFKLSF